LIGIDPKHYTPEAANKVVSNMTEKKSKEKCPPLLMIYSSPCISMTTATKSQPMPKHNQNALMFLGPPGIKVDTDNEDESIGAMAFLSTSVASFAYFGFSTTANAFKIVTPATGTYSWSNMVQQKSPPIPSEVTMPIPTASVTTTFHATSVLTPSERMRTLTSEIQHLREEYKEKLNSNASKIAKIKC
jgi:hypothetical protein